ncbi:unnamed protein product [Bursaphelenchus xylophilus]|nr:unnamed protein product [Bursaphelenchus xylophilus]CAG9100242.1 unnamed protein product [Bursaphelenchus xylophilus]
MVLPKWGKLLESKGFKFRTTAKCHSAYELMHRYDVKLEDFCSADPVAFKSVEDLVGNEDIEERLRLDGLYSLQHERYMRQMEEMKKEMSAELPEDLDYTNIEVLNLECREKLDSLRPLNLAAASRIEGMTPEGLIALLRYVKSNKQRARE